MKSTILCILLALNSTVCAVGTTLCQKSICYSMNIPDTSTSTTGTVYFQISGPTSLAWIAMGAGSRMTSAKMFVIYQSANGQNITLSPRSAIGYSMPSVDDSIQLSLLSGSGVFDGKMVANIRCDSCSTSQSAWVYAYAPGELRSDSISAYIDKHSAQGYMHMDVVEARGGSSTNPFESTAESGTPDTACQINSGPPPAASNSTLDSNGTSVTPSSETLFPPPPEPEPGWWGGARPATPISSRARTKRQSSGEDCSSGSGSGSGSSSFIIDGTHGRSDMETKLMAHGILASLAFAVLFPFGAISIRLFSFPGLVWFHAGLQIVTTAVFIAALVLGVQLASTLGYMNRYHPVIGIVLLALLVVQPVLGQMHHRGFRVSGQRTAWSHAHLWLGRVIITLGIVNGGLGLLLASNTSAGTIVYAVVAGVFYIAYLGAVVLGEQKRLRAREPAVALSKNR